MTEKQVQAVLDQAEVCWKILQDREDAITLEEAIQFARLVGMVQGMSSFLKANCTND